MATAESFSNISTCHPSHLINRFSLKLWKQMDVQGRTKNIIINSDVNRDVSKWVLQT